MASLATYFVVIVVFYLSVVPSLSCPQYQKEALLEFKGLVVRKLYPNQCFNSSRLVLPSWNSSSSCCEWYNVMCTGHVVTELQIRRLFPTAVSSNILAPLFWVSTLIWLDISDNHLQGQIPSSGFGNLTELTTLDMSHNDLNGSVPRELFHQLRSLYYMDVSGNKLAGELPENIGEAVGIVYLYLSNNYLFGSLPKSFSNLSSLGSLDLSRNYLSGTISSVFGPNNSIEILDLSMNRFSGPIIPSLFGPNLSSLYLYQNEFSRVSSQAPNIENLRLLDTFDIHENQVKGPFPAFLLQCPSLSFLDLSNNDFGGPIPSQFQDTDYSGKLGYVKLSNNSFNGPLPQWLKNLSFVCLVDFSNNNLSGSIFHAGLDSIQRGSDANYSVEGVAIDLSYNRFTGPLPSSFPKNLVILSISHNDLSGSLPSSLGNLSGLGYLDLHENNIVGEIPASLFQCSSLDVLDLSNNFIEGSIPRHISNLTAIRILDLSNNNLSGEIPQNFRPTALVSQKGLSLVQVEDSPCSSLAQCVLSDLPSFTTSNGLDASSYIHELILNWKRSEHYLPIKNFNLYSIVDLSNNQLSGPLPASLGELASLKSLNLSHNHFSSHIPNSFGDLESLEVLDLSHNALSGVIPSTLSKLQQLNSIDFSNNQLVGRIPNSPQLDRLNDPKFYANNSGICGLQIQVPCSAPSPARAGDLKKKKARMPYFHGKLRPLCFPYHLWERWPSCIHLAISTRWAK